MKKHISLISKLGDEKPLWTEIQFKDIDIKFGKYGSNVILTYTACIGLEIAGRGEVALYDEIKMHTSLKLGV